MKTIWIALVFVAACSGIILGTSLRDRQDTGGSLFSSSELLALRSSDDATSEGQWFPATAYYDQVRRIIESDYVEEIGDETEMARSSLRYLLRSLGDPETRYYPPDEWNAYMGRMSGRYDGIGVDLNAQETMTPTGLTLPLKVLSVAPGGPAEAAGILAGDIVETLDGRWVASRSLFAELQRASDAFSEKKLSREEYDKIWQQIRDRSERMITVEAAIEKLQTGEGKVSLEVRRNGKLVTAEVNKVSIEVPAVTLERDRLEIRSFGPGAADAINRSVDDIAEVVIDLRRNPGGSLDEVKSALAALTRGGVFAKLRHEPNGPLEDITIEGTKNPIRVVKILVGPGTAREAEVFAYALRDLTSAPMEGGPTAGLARKIQRFALADGSGYSITAGHFFDTSGRPLVREDKAALDARAKAQEAGR